MSMDFTGERFLPFVGGSIELEHVHRYLFATEYAREKVVLDIACGEGYGSAILSKVASHVYGVDIDKEVIQDASKTYSKGNLEFKTGDCREIPLDDNSVDVIVSYETIEHHSHHERMLSEFKRVMKEDGLVIISSPDKLEYSDLSGFINPYHVKELYRAEFESLLGRHFDNYDLLGQRVVYGSILCSGEESLPFSSITVTGDGDAEKLVGLSKPLFLIAIASDSNLPEIQPSLYEKPIVESEVVLDLRAENERKDSLIELCRAQFDSIERELKGKERELEDKDQELREIVNSKIWRWTRFIRIFK